MAYLIFHQYIVIQKIILKQRNRRLNVTHYRQLMTFYVSYKGILLTHLEKSSGSLVFYPGYKYHQNTKESLLQWLIHTPHINEWIITCPIRWKLWNQHVTKWILDTLIFKELSWGHCIGLLLWPLSLLFKLIYGNKS